MAFNMDPSTMRNQMNMVDGMSDEQLENMARMSGMPMNAQMFRSMAAMMKNMDDNQISGMTQQAQQMAQNGQVPAFAGRNPAFGNVNPAGAGMPNVGQRNQNNDNTNRNRARVEKDHPLEIELKEDLKIVDDLKNAANSKFKLGKLDGAKKLYSQALDEVMELKEQNQDNDLTPLNKRVVALKLNLALIMQREKNFKEMLKLSNESLDLDSSNPKAYYRKAIALSSLGKDKFAIVSLKMAKKNYVGDPKGLKGVEELLKKLSERCGEEIEEEEAVIKEEPVAQAPPMPQGMPQMPPPGAMPPLNQQNLDMMKNMMDTPHGAQMIKNMVRAQTGREPTQQEIDAMKNMMTPEMISMAMNMQRNNPGMFNQRGQFPQQPQQAQRQAQAPTDGPIIQEVNPQAGQQPNPQAPQNPPNMPPNNFDPQNMPTDMDSLFQNSQMMDTVFAMLKTNPAMLRMMFQQMGDNHPAAGFIKGRTDEQLKSLVIWMERFVKFLRFFWPAIKFIYAWRRTIGVLIVAFIIKRYFL